MDEVENEGKPVLLIAEGLFMYFTEKELRLLFKQLLERFPGAELLFEMLAPILVGRSKRHESVKKIDNVEFKWGLIDARDVARWHPNIEYVEEWDYYDYFKKRWRWFRPIARLPVLRPRMPNRIVHLRFADPVDREGQA
jgi:O-methyltransferase involved in polyketide biosynthesis